MYSFWKNQQYRQYKFGIFLILSQFLTNLYLLSLYFGPLYATTKICKCNKSPTFVIIYVHWKNVNTFEYIYIHNLHKKYILTYSVDQIYSNKTIILIVC